MARKLEQITIDMLGSYAFQVAQLSARLEAQADELADLKRQLADATASPRLALVNEEKVS